MLGIMADLCVTLGLYERGLRYIDKSLIYVRRSGEHFAQSELFRIKGELQHAIGNVADARRWYNRALFLARKQHARTWERAAAVRMADLSREQPS